MSALKTQIQRARGVLDALVQGVHPKSGNELPEDSVVNEIEVNRAMSTAVLALDQMSARLARRALLPESVGKTWTGAEEQRLIKAIRAGELIADIASRHGRTIRAIESRLSKLGLLSADQRTTSDQFVRVSTRED